MDGSPQVVRFDATTLWHLDAAEWAPSTASIADLTRRLGHVSFTPQSGQRADTLGCPLRANRVLTRRSKKHRYSITSSASASTLAGMVRPSARAVLRLITNSNLVGSTTGRSAGLAPLRISPAYMPAWR